MKKLVGILLALCLFASLSCSVFAEQVSAEEQLQYYLGLGEYEDITAEDMPLWNRAIMSMYAPGSTFKPITALAALEENGVHLDFFPADSDIISSCIAQVDI